MTPEQIAELERLEREAAPAPWRAEADPPGGVWVEVMDARGEGVAGVDKCGAFFQETDARLITETRNALPSLLSSARDLAALRAAVEEQAKSCEGNAVAWRGKTSKPASEVYEEMGRVLRYILLPGGDADREGGR